MTRQRSRRGFSMAEAMIGLSLMALSGAVVLVAMDSSLQTADDNVERLIAAGMARQVVDEVVGGRYRAYGVTPYQTPLGPNSYEASGAGRERFNDTDDFAGYTAQPADNPWGQPWGTGNDYGGPRHPEFQVRADRFNRWRQEIDVYYVSPANQSVRLTGSQTSAYRAVEVRVSRERADGTFQELARARRVFAYVPEP